MFFSSRFLTVEGKESGLLASRDRSKCSFSSEWCGRVEGPRAAALQVVVAERARVGSSLQWCRGQRLKEILPQLTKCRAEKGRMGGKCD